MSYAFVAEHQREYPVERLCHALGVSVSGYYAWRQREPSQHQQTDGELLTEICTIHQASRGLYGSPRVHAALRRQGRACSRKRVARLMRQAGLFSRRRWRHRVRTTDSQHTRPVAPNVLLRDFSAHAPNQKWVGDILGFWTSEGWLYLAALLDTFSRRIVGWAMSPYRDEALVTGALHLALGQRLPDVPLIHHTDRGSQYTATEYLALLQTHGIIVSMSRQGDPYDNAMMESFFSTLRAECIELQPFPTRAAARLVVFEYIEVFYNRLRLHSALGYSSPADYEAAYFQSHS
jgi:putative transposase